MSKSLLQREEAKAFEEWFDGQSLKDLIPYIYGYEKRILAFSAIRRHVDNLLEGSLESLGWTPFQRGQFIRAAVACYRAELSRTFGAERDAIDAIEEIRSYVV